MVCGVVTARFVEPTIMGLFTGITLIQGYIPFLQLGVSNGLNRELPYYVGKGEQSHVQELAATAQAWSLVLGGGTAVGLTGVAFWQGACGNWMQAAGWMTNAITAFFLFYGTYYLQITFRTRGDFARLALINVVQSVVSLVFVVLVWWLAFYGLCLRALVVVAVQLALLWYWRPVKVNPRLRKEPFVHLLKIGGPIFVVGQVYAYWGTLDSTLLLYYCDTRSLGLYSLATMASATVLMLPQALSQVLYPQMAEQYGRTHDVLGIVKLSLRPMAFACLAMAGMTVVGWHLVPPVVKLLVPRYVDGIAAVQWSLLTAPVMCLQPINNVFNVVKRQDLFALAIGLGMAAYYVCLRALLRDGPELVAFPQAMLAGKAVYILVSYVAVFRIIHKCGRTQSNMCQ